MPIPVRFFYWENFMSNLLLDEHPLIILPSLAVKIGLNEAIFLQQLHYWLKKTEHIIDNKKWVYNTYEQWRQQLPFFCIRTLKTTVTSLINKGFIDAKSLSADKRNKTNYYTINYQKFNDACTMDVQNLHDGECKTCTMESAKLAPSSINTETTTNITTDIITTSQNPSDVCGVVEKVFSDNKKEEEKEPDNKKAPCPFQRIADLYNLYLSDFLPAIRDIKQLTQGRKSKIAARWRHELKTVDEWEDFYIKIAKSDFLTGQIPCKDGTYPRFCNFDWIINESNCTKILEGKYDNDDKNKQRGC
jgi:hypothetical protein